MSELFEIIMLICFGISWPLDVVKSFKAKTAKGKSGLFLCLIWIGYIAGIVSKFLNDRYMAEFRDKWHVLFFYFLNLIMVSTNICIYIRNSRLDRKNTI